MTVKQIRPARTDEMEELTQLVVRATESDGYPPDFVAQIMDALRIKPALVDAGLVLVAERDQGIKVGVISLNLLGPVGLFLLEGIYVDPGFMRQGVGRCLMDAARELARKKFAGCSMIIYANPPSTGFYARLGAIRIGMAPFVFSPDLLLPVFAYPLSSAVAGGP